MPDLVITRRVGKERGHQSVFAKFWAVLSSWGWSWKWITSELFSCDITLSFFLFLFFLAFCVILVWLGFSAKRYLTHLKVGWLWDERDRKKRDVGKKARWLGIVWPRWPFFYPESSTLGKRLNKENILSPVTCFTASGKYANLAQSDWGQESTFKDGHCESCFINWHHSQAQIWGNPQKRERKK